MHSLVRNVNASLRRPAAAYGRISVYSFHTTRNDGATSRAQLSVTLS